MNEEKDWLQVYTTNTEIDAELIKQNLEMNEIPVQILSQVDSTRQFTIGELAIVKLFVLREDFDKAQNIISQIQNGEFSL